jgi:hypothetical protein
MGSLFPSPPNSSSTVSIDNSQGVISIQANLEGNGTPASGWGPLLSVTFNTTYATPYPQPKDTCTLEIANDTLYGIGNQTINHDVVNGVYKAPYAPPQPNLTLNTDKNNYHFEDRININGTLTGNGYPIPDALIALEVQDLHGILVVARTFQTSGTQPSCPLQITELTPCNLTGERQDSFAVGSLVCFDVAVKNTGSNSLNGLVVVNLYDSSNTSLGVTYLTVPVPARSNTSMLLCLPLQYDTLLAVTPPTSGNATAYASIWTDLVENGGTPMSLESETTFTITCTAQHNPTSANPPPQATCQTNLSLHFKKGTYSLSQPPNYTIYVGATYMGIGAMQSKQIQITIAGDVNTDGRVNLSA